jgi:DNA repair protein RadC
MSDSTNLFTSDAEGVTRPATADEILDAARTILARRVRKGAPLSNPRATRDYLRLRLAVQDHEVFAILFLDNRHRVIEFVPLFRGTIDGASVHPREVVKEALSRNAAAIAHPPATTSSPTASRSTTRVTARKGSPGSASTPSSPIRRDRVSTSN